MFNRDKKIGFTRTPKTLALPDGAQDRFSMVMQLASLVRGEPDAYKPGVTRQFFVVDNDSGETGQSKRLATKRPHERRLSRCAAF